MVMDSSNASARARLQLNLTDGPGLLTGVFCMLTAHHRLAAGFPDLPANDRLAHKTGLPALTRTERTAYSTRETCNRRCMAAMSASTALPSKPTQCTASADSPRKAVAGSGKYPPGGLIVEEGTLHANGSHANFHSRLVKTALAGDTSITIDRTWQWAVTPILAAQHCH